MTKFVNTHWQGFPMVYNVAKINMPKISESSGINLFKPYPETLALALIRPTLIDWVQGKIQRTAPPNLHPRPNSYHTPYGLYKYDGTGKLNLISISCVNETGTVIRVQIREIYLAHILGNQAVALNLDLDSFWNTIIEGKQAIIAGVEGVDPPRLMYSTEQEVIEVLSNSEQNASSNSAIMAIREDRDLTLYSTTGVSNPLQTATGEYCFTYWQTTTDSKGVEMMRRLENIVAYCHSNNLSVLPSPECEDWCVHVLQPTLNSIRAKISENKKQDKD